MAPPPACCNPQQRNYKAGWQVKREKEKRLKVASVSSSSSSSFCNMASTAALIPTELFAEGKGIWRKNWRNRIRFLLRNNSSPSVLHVMKNRSCRPSADDVKQWAESLDKLLTHKYGKAAFFIFLKSEFCEENIEFWTACEDFRTLSSHTDMVSKANRIYEEFIKNEAPKEINLDYHTKNAISQSLHQPTPTCFLAAQMKVYSLMENNSYTRFINSDFYQKLCAAASGQVDHRKL
ncbi:regulator of G-protein signaling 2 [Cynoglossus semilaevis]|uniref:Regulator of G protein signaling 2 n=1 Tax=Cynoglossus semilaevis TaxID=244447 RepID=A0A3P8ULS4_CYNSE|nr:regulator of G-protein signaling 2 [Cynoglossus semilaevis]